MGLHAHVQHRNKQIVKQYREGMSVIDLATEFRISKSSICAVLQTAGWPNRPVIRTLEERAMRVLFARGRWSEANLLTIGAKLGYSKTQLRDLIVLIVKGEPEPTSKPLPAPRVYTKPPKLVAPEVPGEKITDEFGAYVDAAQGESENDE